MALTRSRTGTSEKKETPARREAARLLTSRANGPFVESFRLLALSVRRLLEGDDAKTVLVMSAFPRDGRSTIAANLAIALAENDRVLLADFRPEADRESGWLQGAILNGGKGFTNGSGNGADAGLPESMPGPLLSTLHPQVWFMDPGERVLRSGRLSETIRAAGANGFYTVIDSPPALDSSDAYRLAEQVGKVLYVVRTNPQRREAHEQICNVLGRLNAEVIGVVINEY